MPIYQRYMLKLNKIATVVFRDIPISTICQTIYPDKSLNTKAFWTFSLFCLFSMPSLTKFRLVDPYKKEDYPKVKERLTNDYKSSRRHTNPFLCCKRYV